MLQERSVRVERGVWLVTAAPRHALSQAVTESLISILRSQTGRRIDPAGPRRGIRNLADLAWKSPSHHKNEQGLPTSIGVSACREDVTNHVTAYVLAEIQCIFI